MSSDTRFMSQLPMLTTEQLIELHESFTNASIANELGASWRVIFQAKAIKYRVGYKNRIYTMLSKMHFSKIELLSSATAKKF